MGMTHELQSCWLSPTGHVTYVTFAEHCIVADEILKKIAPDMFDSDGFPIRDYDATEELERRGYIRYCDWGVVPGWVIRPDVRYTKAQIDAMFELTGDTTLL